MLLGILVVVLKPIQHRIFALYWPYPKYVPNSNSVLGLVEGSPKDYGTHIAIDPYFRVCRQFPH